MDVFGKSLVVFHNKLIVVTKNLKKMNYFLGIVGPIGVLTFIISYLLITITSLVFILKNEKGLDMFLWLLVIFMLPFLGGGIYILKHFLSRKLELRNN